MFLNISSIINDEFYKIVALGLGSAYIVQVLLTVGGSTKFIPMTGVTLPLVSYGGSSILATIIVFSIIQGIYVIYGEKRVTKNKYEKNNKKKFDTVKLKNIKIDKKSSSQIIFIIYLFTIIFVGLFSYLIMFQIKKSEELKADYRNPRLIAREKRLFLEIFILSKKLNWQRRKTR